MVLAYFRSAGDQAPDYNVPGAFSPAADPFCLAGNDAFICGNSLETGGYEFTGIFNSADG
jgi:hypothetical protein